MTEEQAARVVAHGRKWKCGYVLDGDVLAELLAIAAGDTETLKFHRIPLNL